LTIYINNFTLSDTACKQYWL